MSMHGWQDFIRKGREHVETGELKEAAIACSVIDVPSMQVYDNGDNMKAVLLTDLDMACAPGDTIPANTTVFFVRQGKNAIVKCSGSGSISEGNELTATGGAGAVIADTDGQETIDKMGCAYAGKDSDGWVWVDLAA